MLSDYGDSSRPLWSDWYIGDLLERECCGAVHAVTRGEGNLPHSSVVKLCRFPSEPLYRKAASIFRNDSGKIARYFADTLEGIIYKLHLLSSMANHSSIVNYYDYKIGRPEEGPGRLVIFRRDHIVPLARYIQDNPLTGDDVIRLGMELCEALSYHLKRGAVQGHLRMDNVFVSPEGAFKLGDTFEYDLLGGKAPALPLFAAPEVLLKENFDHTADIYTLGLIMYKLLNRGCLPFAPSPTGKLEPRESKRALARRGKKGPLPPPALAGEALGALILKACSGEPSRRFTTPLEMKLALESLASDPDERPPRSPVPAAGPAVEGQSAPGEDAVLIHTGPAEPEKAPVEETPDELSPKPEEQEQTDPVSAEREPAPRPLTSGRANYIIAAGLLLLVTIAAALLYFYHRPALQSEPLAEDGNTAGNINNKGLAVLYGGYLYYADPTEGSAIRRSRPDRDDKSKLGSSHALYLNIADDWIYYVNSDSYSQIYKIRTDGSDNQKLMNDSASFILVSGGLLYYANMSDLFYLYRVDLDGNEPTRLNEEPTAYVNISGNWIYYLNKEDKHIYKMRLDGSEKNRLNRDQSSDIQVVDGWVYFRNISDHWRLYRTSTAGTGSDRLTHDPVYQFNVDDDGGIFFTNGGDGKSLYRLIIDESARSTEQIKLNDDSTSNLNMAGEWIYYINESEGGGLYRINSDGTSRAAVE